MVAASWPLLGSPSFQGSKHSSTGMPVEGQRNVTKSSAEFWPANQTAGLVGSDFIELVGKGKWMGYVKSCDQNVEYIIFCYSFMYRPVVPRRKAYPFPVAT